MKLRLLLLLCSLQLVSYAQRFGVDVGYAYAWNSFKNLDPINDSDYDLKERYKQASFPNFSFGSCLRVYKRLSVGVGVDLVKYQLKKEMVYHGYYYDRIYHYNYMASEMHFPIMVRVEALRIKDKHRLSFYGGMFARVFGMRKAAIDVSPDYDANNTLAIYKKRQQYTCLTVGAHQAFFLNSYWECYIDARFKYMPGYYYTPAEPVIPIPSFRVSNTFAFSLSAGISFVLPDKEKTPYSNPARLQD